MQGDYDWFMDPELRRLSRQWMETTEAASRAIDDVKPGTGLNAEQQGLIREALAAEQAYFQHSARLRGETT